MDPKFGNFKPGDSLTCRVESAEPGGYLVSVLPSGMKGFLPSSDPLFVGQIVPSTYVCMDGEKALLAYAYMIGTTERVQLSTASDSENAFSVWADSYPQSERMKRAVDAIMPPLDGKIAARLLPASEVSQFLSELERSNFTGCLKVDAQFQPSRSGAVFFNGRAIGGIYTRKDQPGTYPIEQALRLMLEDLRATDCQVQFYELPGEIVLPLAASFLGVVLEKKLTAADNLKYLADLLSQYAARKLTGCLVLHQSQPLALAYVNRGEYQGCYSIVNRSYSQSVAAVEEQIRLWQAAELLAYVLPDAVRSPNMLFGYSLLSSPFPQL